MHFTSVCSLAKFGNMWLNFMGTRRDAAEKIYARDPPFNVTQGHGKPRQLLYFSRSRQFADRRLSDRTIRDHDMMTIRFADTTIRGNAMSAKRLNRELLCSPFCSVRELWCRRKVQLCRDAAVQIGSRPAVEGHSRSWEPTQIDWSHVASYQWHIVTMGLFCTVSRHAVCMPFACRCKMGGHAPTSLSLDTPVHMEFDFYCATLCVSAVFAVARCPSVRPSVCRTRSCILSRRLRISSKFFVGPVAPSF